MWAGGGLTHNGGWTLDTSELELWAGASELGLLKKSALWGPRDGVSSAAGSPEGHHSSCAQGGLRSGQFIVTVP